MVKRVYGTADNINLMFTRNAETGQWETAVPVDVDGSYVVALYAEDDAGNSAYVATILFTVDPNKLCVTIQWLDINAQAEATTIQSLTSLVPTVAEFGMREVQADIQLKSYNLTIVGCELCRR